MPGIFGLFDYTKEGPGVPLNAPPKSALRVFFDVLARKFWKIVTINLMYLLFSLPVLLLAAWLAQGLIASFLPGFTVESLKQLLADSGAALTEEQLAAQAAFTYQVVWILVALLAVGIGYVTAGPVLAGTTLLLRNYAREEHAFVWMDFKETVRENWKQALAVCALAFAFLFFLAWDSSILNALAAPAVQGIVSGLLIVVGILVAMMLMYLYPMMVTFRLPFRQLLRNALLFSLARFLPNLGILLLNAFLLFGIPFLVGLFLNEAIAIFSAIWFLFLVFGLTQYITVFYVQRQFQRFILDKAGTGAAAPPPAAPPPPPPVDEPEERLPPWQVPRD